MFLTSTRVPKASVPRGRSETLASTRIWPRSMSASLAPMARSSIWSSSAYRRACSAVRMSGSVTISMSGAPDRLKSTSEARPSATSAASSWTSFAVSSSRCARVIGTLNGPAEVSIASRPRAASGIAYWLIW